MLLEKAKAADAEEILSLYRRAAAAGRENGSSDWNDEYPSAETIAFDLGEGGLFVLREEGRIEAAVSLLPTDDLDELPLDWTKAKSRVLARLCVEPALQGMGLGARVVGLAEAISREEGCKSIRLLCALDNPAAARVYQKRGYRKTGEAFLYETRFAAFERTL